MPENVNLFKLRDLKSRVADPAEDVRGRKVLDSTGDEIGEIADLVVDEREWKVRFLSIKSGDFLGFGDPESFVPVDAIRAVADDRIQIELTRDCVARAHPTEPNLVEQPDWEGLYDHFGYRPYWVPGYVYPPFPHYSRESSAI